MCEHRIPERHSAKNLSSYVHGKLNKYILISQPLYCVFISILTTQHSDLYSIFITVVEQRK
jgi:hypothetical protein